MARTFKSLIPKVGQPKAGPPRTPSKPVSREQLDATAETVQADNATAAESKADANARATEIGGPDGPEPTRYGDWERGGICYDF